jgi:F-type H+-transporting ATPase subunit b
MVLRDFLRAVLPGCLLLLAVLGLPAQRGWSQRTDTDHQGASTSADENAGESHAPTAEGEVNPVVVDPDLAIFTALIFLLLLAILGKFAWKPIIEALDRRERSVADQIAAARAAQEDSQRLLAEHQTKLAGAADEVRQMLDQARREAELTKQQVVAEAQQAAAVEKQRAISEIEAAKNSALRDLAQHSVDSAIGLAGKIMRRQLRPEDHESLIRESLNEFPSQN